MLQKTIHYKTKYSNNFLKAITAVCSLWIILLYTTFSNDRFNFKVIEQINVRQSAVGIFLNDHQRKKVDSAVSSAIESSFNSNDAQIRNLNTSGHPRATKFVDELFQPMLDLFKKFNPSSFSPPSKEVAVPKFLLVSSYELNSSFWTVQTKEIKDNECPLPCAITDDVSDTSVLAVVFHLRDIFLDPVKLYSRLQNRDLSKPWILLSFEAHRFPPSLSYHSLYSQYNNIFNRTMTFRTDADIIFNHGFVVSKDDVKHLPRTWVRPTVPYQKGNYEKKLIAAFISNCNDNGGRMDYIKELQKYTHVYVYGECGKYKCGSRMYVEQNYSLTNDKCYKRLSEKFLFYLSFENSLCKDYVTEKLYNILYYNIIPVVFGGADYSKILPPKSYINALDYTPKELVRHLLYLKRNPDLYDEYMSWKKYYQVSTLDGNSPLCHLCARLHDPSLYKKAVLNDFGEWFATKSVCTRWKPKKEEEDILWF